MNVVLYDLEKYGCDEIQKVFESVNTGKYKGEWIFIPRDFQVLLDCRLNELYNIRNQLNEIIQEKEEKELKKD